MLKVIVEVGMPLDKSLISYHDILINNGFSLSFACVTRDVYYANQTLDGLTENQMKNACVRIRFCDALNKKANKDKVLLKKEQELIRQGYRKVFDTVKIDFQYKIKGMKSAVQLQDIKDIGLIVYYDNPDYYDFSLDEQRKLLLDELNSYGFNFNENDLGLDKLRTLYYGKKMYSKNQNG